MVDDAVNICGIKRYAVDNAGDIPVPQCAEPTGKTVAVVGGGPGGLTAAYFLTVMICPLSSRRVKYSKQFIKSGHTFVWPFY